MQRHKPDGFNIGINIGQHAGQTIQHVHIHLIPRYKGDVENPVGGVRNVIPELGNYLDTQH
jgi:diadenosine tetraphosphate (Ap4A) HIT family hydrolase